MGAIDTATRHHLYVLLLHGYTPRLKVISLMLKSAASLGFDADAWLVA